MGPTAPRPGWAGMGDATQSGAAAGSSRKLSPVTHRLANRFPSGPECEPVTPTAVPAVQVGGGADAPMTLELECKRGLRWTSQSQ